MSDPYVGEIRIFGGNFAPRGWALCQGQVLPIVGNDALFAILGTTYGGDGRTNFALPDLRGRAIVGAGFGPGLSNYPLGSRAGTEEVTLTVNQMPPHAIATSSSPRTHNRPAAGLGLATGGAYAPVADADGVQHQAGGGEPHNNMPPFLVINYIIALVGVFPSRP